MLSRSLRRPWVSAASLALLVGLAGSPAAWSRDDDATDEVEEVELVPIPAGVAAAEDDAGCGCGGVGEDGAVPSGPPLAALTVRFGLAETPDGTLTLAVSPLGASMVLVPAGPQDPDGEEPEEPFRLDECLAEWDAAHPAPPGGPDGKKWKEWAGQRSLAYVACMKRNVPTAPTFEKPNGKPKPRGGSWTDKNGCTWTPHTDGSHDPHWDVTCKNKKVAKFPKGCEEVPNKPNRCRTEDGWVYELKKKSTGPYVRVFPPWSSP